MHVSNDHGNILIGDEAAGHLYVKGIWVCKLNGDNWTFGYDLKNVQLDRDRSIPCQYTLKRAIRSIISKSAKTGALTRDQLWELFKGESQESKEFGQDYIDRYDGAHMEVAARFREEHGEDAVPFTTPAEQSKAIQAGLKPVFVSPTLKAMLQGHVRNLDDALAERQFEVECFYSTDSLRTVERKNLEWALYMVGSEESWVEGCVQVVDFYGENLLGRFSYKDGERTIQISRKVLRDDSQTAAVLIHEASHIYGDDGTPEHSAAMQRMSGRLLSRFARYAFEDDE